MNLVSKIKILFLTIFIIVFPMVFIIVCGIDIKGIQKINNSSEIRDLIYVISITTLLVFLLLSSFLLMSFSLFIMYVSFKRIRFNITIYKIFGASSIAFNILLFVFYLYYTKQSENNLRSFLTQRIQEINHDKILLSLNTMNIVQQ